MYRYLKDLPIVVTKNSNPLFYVATYAQKEINDTTLKEENVATRRNIKLNKNGYCPHFILGGNSCRRCNG